MKVARPFGRDTREVSILYDDKVVYVRDSAGDHKIHDTEQA